MNASVQRLAYQPVKAHKLVLQKIPPIPDSMVKRFPELKAWNEAVAEAHSQNERLIRDYITQATAQSSP